MTINLAQELEQQDEYFLDTPAVCKLVLRVWQVLE